ncbi:MAG: aldehyde dehydrogenase family protein, partial [Bacteroidetes bacterium]
TPSGTFPTLFAEQQAASQRIKHTDARQRLAKLQRIADFLDQPANITALSAALQADFNKPTAEIYISEVGVVWQQLKFIRKHLRTWMAAQRVATPLPLLGTRSYLRKEPKGVCLIMAPWNYPFNLAILPLLYAIAAGNTVILKPSEISANTSAFIKRMIDSLFPAEEVAVVEGDAKVASALLDLPFNHIFFTGSPQVGKIVMKAASKHLSSVTLELGGKSPTVIDTQVDVVKTAKDTAWAKCFNAGQTCIAPDYLLVHESIAEEFAQAYVQAIKDMYGQDIATSPDYARIISHKHYARLYGLLEDALAKGAQLQTGGKGNAAERFLPPILLTQVTEDMKVMDEEIFGPLMPMMTYRHIDEVIDLINRRPRPLSLYVQSKRSSFVRHILNHTSSGGANVNAYLLGYANPDLPFGGINNSGIGKSMGYHGFVEFCNERGIIERRFGNVRFLYPPYSKWVTKLADKLFRWL